MKKNTFKIENLLSSFPNDRQEIHLHVDRLKKYKDECGCSMGAKFLIASMGIFIIYFFHSHHFGIVDLLQQILLGIFSIFTSSIVGKIIGIGIARIRLALLYKHLFAKYPISGE